MSTFRSDVVAHLAAIARAYAVANPTKLRQVWTSRPSAFGETPAAYVGDRPETIDADAGTLRRTITTEVVVVDTFRDNEQVTDAMDDVVDALASAYALDANAHVGGGIIDVKGVADGDLPIASTNGTTLIYRSAAITIEAIVQEGRN